MKIITFEEHISDPIIGAASGKALMEAYPWLAVPVQDPSFSPSPEILGDMGAGRIAVMDANGIDMQILSSSNAPQLIAAPEAVSLVADANDRIAEAIKANPDRLAAFAMLPLSDPEAAAIELERTVTKLGFKGAMITGRPSADAFFLDDERYAPVLETANRLEVPIYVHPGFPFKAVQEAYYSGFSPIVTNGLSTFSWGWHAEVGVQIIRMILAGVFEKYPKLQLIAGHWGEMVPFFLARLDQTLSKEDTKLPRTITEYFKEHVYVTPSGMFTMPHFLFTLDLLGADRILYSVDYPYISNEGARAFLENAPISQEDKEKIAHGNAEKLLKLK